MSRYSKNIGIVAMLFILGSCAPRLIEGADKLPRTKDAPIKESLDSLSNVSFDFFYAKIATKYRDTSQNFSFKSSVRIAADSVINTLITFAKIPMVNAIVTHDSLLIVDKRQKCVTLESLGLIKDRFGVEFKYRNVEELFFGLPIGYEPDKKYYRVANPYAYTLCSHNRREIKKNDRKDRRELVTYYTLTNDLNQLKSIRIESPEDDIIVFIDYLTFEKKGNYRVPKKVNIVVSTPEQDMTIILTYKKTRVNEVEKIHFVIPEKYGKCE